MIEDENDEAQYGDRIPYVIVRGEPNSRLVDRAVAPQELLNNRSVFSCQKRSETVLITVLVKSNLTRRIIFPGY
jgi:DNA polymerase elongation subunit (family B)